MPTFLIFSRHSPESCPGFNEKTRKTWLALFDKMDGLLKKHGIKLVGNWIVVPEHLSVVVFEAPSLEALLKYAMEPEVTAMSATSTTEIKAVSSLEEVKQNLQQIQ
jgi:uncharacterized protein with GYD domain